MCLSGQTTLNTGINRPPTQPDAPAQPNGTPTRRNPPTQPNSPTLPDDLSRATPSPLPLPCTSDISGTQ